jgi:hypothetical protein
VSRRPKFLRTFNPDGKSHGHNKGSRSMDALSARSASSASSVMQRHAARLDPFLVPRLRKPTYL